MTMYIANAKFATVQCLLDRSEAQKMSGQLLTILAQRPLLLAKPQKLFTSKPLTSRSVHLPNRPLPHAAHASMRKYPFQIALYALAQPNTRFACFVLKISSKCPAKNCKWCVAHSAKKKDLEHRSSICRWRGQGERSFFLFQYTLLFECTLTRCQDFQDGLLKFFECYHTPVCSRIT
jgi:hypothetical protein